MLSSRIISVVPQVQPTSYFSPEKFPVKTALPRGPCVQEEGVATNKEGGRSSTETAPRFFPSS